MNRSVTIIMYHCVRDLENSRYSGIKGLDTSLFKEQIAYLKKHYSIITMEQLIDSIDNNTSLPPKSALLTFDDAYIDHYTQVFPELMLNQIQGSFFVPVMAIKEHSVLDVNMIHYILASGADSKKIVGEIFRLLDYFRAEYNLKENAVYYEKFAVAERYDSGDTIFIKRFLQKGLEDRLRKIIVKELFNLFVAVPENVFSRELYMTTDQIRFMRESGMHIGSHGFDHYWMGTLIREQQEQEIENSIKFLQLIGCDMNAWTMCYPYGSYNKDTIDIVQSKGCKLALTTKVDIADLAKYKKFELPRLDTNDIPTSAEADTNNWWHEG